VQWNRNVSRTDRRVIYWHSTDLISWWFADCFNRVFDCSLEYLTVLLEYIDLEWQGTANIWASLCPARPALGYTSVSYYGVIVKIEAKKGLSATYPSLLPHVCVTKAKHSQVHN